MMSFSVIAAPSRLPRVVRRLDRSAGGLPGTEAAGDMRHRFQAHPLRGFRRQRRALPGRAKEYEALVRGEDRLVIFALRIDPEFQHAARTMEGARHPALAMELADVAQIDEDDVVAAMERERIMRGQGLDDALGRFDQGLDVDGDVLWHGLLPPLRGGRG